MSGQGLQLPSAIPSQQEATACIQSRGISRQSKKVLAEKNIFVSVTVEVGDIDAEGGSELRFARQGNGVKMVTSVKEDHGRKRCHLDFVHARLVGSEHVGHGSFAIG